MFCGISSGATFAAALQGGARSAEAARCVLAMLPDTGERYLSHGAVRRHSRWLRSRKLSAPCAAARVPARAAGALRDSAAAADERRRDQPSPLPDPFRCTAAACCRRAHCLRELGPAERRARQRHAAVHRTVALGACRRHRARSAPGLVAAHDRPGAGHRYRAATSWCASIRWAAASARPAPLRIDPATGRALSARFPRGRGRGHRARRLRDRARARHRAAGVRHGRLARRHVGDRLCGAVSAGRAAPDQHFRVSPPPRRSRSRCARCSAKRSCAIRTGRAATIPPIIRRATACAWRASSAPSPIARRPNGASASGASPIGGQRADAPSPFAPRFAVEGYLRGAGRALHRASSTPTATCTCRAPWTASIWPSTAAASPPRCSAGACRGRAGDRRRERLAVSDPRAGGDRGGVRAGRRFGTRFARLPSLEGHDAFLVDIPRFDAEIRAFLA